MMGHLNMQEIGKRIPNVIIRIFPKYVIIGCVHIQHTEKTILLIPFTLNGI